MEISDIFLKIVICFYTKIKEINNLMELSPLFLTEIIENSLTLIFNKEEEELSKEEFNVYFKNTKYNVKVSAAQGISNGFINSNMYLLRNKSTSCLLLSSTSGFCHINDIVMCIQELLKSFKRVMYIDIDCHAGIIN